MQNLTEDYKTEAKKNQNRPILLYDIYLGNQDVCDDDTKYFCTNNRKVQFWNMDGDLKSYLPLGVKRTAIPLSSKLEIEMVTAEFDNADGAWSNWISNFDLRGKKIIVRMVFKDLLTDPTHAKICFYGEVNCVTELTREKISIEFKSKIKSLAVETGAMMGLYCNNIFGDEDCGFSISSTKVTGQTVDSGSTKTQIIDASRTEADDYWKDGMIKFTSGQNSGQVRRVISFSQSEHKLTLDYGLDNTPQPGDEYELQQGCDLSLSVCTNRFSNQANFNAAPHIPLLINPIVQ